MQIELSMTSPRLNTLMGSPHVHELELLPLNPSTTSKAQPLCISSRSSRTTRSTIEAFNSQSGTVHASGSYRLQRLRAEACIDVNQIPPENQEEFAGAEFPFTLQLSYDTKPSLNGSKRAASSSRPLVPTPCPEPANALNFEHERTPNDVSTRGSDDEDGVSITKKKLRLSKEESSLLEESFKEHTTLNPKQKNKLAKQLNLRPRQVEVWFQNRRARTKLKQIEADSEMLKRCCEALTEENRRLQREVAELRALKVQGGPCVIPHDFCMPIMPSTTMAMCASCEHLAACPTARTTSTNTSISSFNQPSNLSLTLVHQQLSLPACN